MENIQKTSARRILARRYRPKFLKDLIGQDVLVQALTKGIQEKSLPQALLFSGIRGTGKTSTARILARAVNCRGSDGTGSMPTEPCGVCPSCKALDEERHVDVVEMDAASHTGVDDMRDIIDSTQYKAVLGRSKVFIIDEVHMLSKSAFNALLKTLEEPPAHVLFIFATTEKNKIPETILSRCACFDLKRVASKTLMDHFQKVATQEGFSLEKDALALLARSAEGSVRDGLTLLDQAMNLTEAKGLKDITSETVQTMLGATNRQSLYDVLAKILARNAEEAVSLVRALTEGGADPVAVMQDLLECLYRAACLKILPRLAEDDSIPEFERQAAGATAALADDMQLLSLWKMMLKGFEDVKKAPFAQQALEMVVLRLCFAAALPSIEQLLEKMSPEEAQGGEKEDEKKNATFEKQPGNILKPPIIETPKVVPEPPFEARMEAGFSSEPPFDMPVSPQNLPQWITISSPAGLCAALEHDREALLLTYIKRDLAFVSFERGSLTVQIKNKEGEKVLPDLKRYLKTKTGQAWTMEKADGPSKTSLQEQENAARTQKREEILKDPFVQKIQDLFPGAVVQFEKP
ncbi:DNA polymerase III subunit gamma/tau [Alphaproteobacteria bacterium]|nr:DNA polymerase III subunit gamma/tau [Alphaproteobacteria bacterium]